ncbi:hypothetical protein GIB67_019584 [Kingdonia uniflora]|uniref:Neuroguidin n=1 Tax=Kingdonia uniflora TaxID=39325 RepID=A0A7J7N0R9_9MAGN|nr:hypothetical protein GIB67_019584 [Kingdonia uniflora]
MGEVVESKSLEEVVTEETPNLVALLKQIKQGLDIVMIKVKALTAKVRESQLLTSDGISYLEAKHLLLLSYCQSMVYYLLRKAKGLSIEGHPVVRSLVEIRLFLEKIRPIDKKMEYQIQKFTGVGGSAVAEVAGKEKEVEDSQSSDLLRHRANPDQLVSKTTNGHQNDDGLFHPNKFAPQTIEENKMTKQDKLAQRRQKEELRKAKQNPYVRELMDEIEEKPEEVKESRGSESKEVFRFKEKMNKRARDEENLFTRAPLTRVEKKKEQHLKKLKNGLDSLTDGFFSEIKTFTEDDDGKHMSGFNRASRGGNKFNKHKVYQAYHNDDSG